MPPWEAMGPRAAASRCATSSAGGCGDKDQVSRTRPMYFACLGTTRGREHLLDISIRGRNVDVSEALRQTVEEKVTRLTRFLDGMERAEVRFTEERNPRIVERDVCEVTMHGHGHIIRARAAAPDAFAAVDRVVDKLEHRMEKLKGKLVSRSHPRRPASLHFGAEGANAEQPASSEPRIVKTKKFDMKPMTPEEAALQMDLVGHDFYFFTSAETGQAAVVYRRGDGHFGLIDAG